MRRRMLMILAAGAVGLIFAAGLFFHGRVGGGLLLVTDAVLIGLAMSVWGNTEPRKRPVRVIVILAIAVLAVIKMVR
jgi:hypothetical protein